MTLLSERPASAATASASDRPYRILTVQPLAGSLGAQVSGVQLGGHLDPAAVAEIRRALLEHKVVFFTGQQHLDDAGQYEFATLLGRPTRPHPTVRGNENYLLVLDSERPDADGLDADVTFVDRVPAVSLLRPVALPAHGADTVWADSVAGYADLHPDLRTLTDRLRAVHSNLPDDAVAGDERPTSGLEGEEPAYRDELTSQAFVTEHPVVRIHPRTGERTLLLGPFVRRLVGLSSHSSADLLALLQRHLGRVENTVRWRWSAGDLAVWDSRATVHQAGTGGGDGRRVLHRVTLAGDVPLGVDGAHSVARRGSAAAFSALG